MLMGNDISRCYNIMNLRITFCTSYHPSRNARSQVLNYARCRVELVANKSEANIFFYVRMTRWRVLLYSRTATGRAMHTVRCELNWYIHCGTDSSYKCALYIYNARRTLHRYNTHYCIIAGMSNLRLLHRKWNDNFPNCITKFSKSS